MSRRKEIKEKELLQAKFQTALSQNNDKVLKWLQPQKTSEANHFNKDFLNLPIVGQGQGLNSISDSDTINDFMKDEKKVAQTRVQNQSKPMSMLMNKMRNNNRDKVKRNIINNQRKIKVEKNGTLANGGRKEKPKNVKNNNSRVRDESSDSESEDDGLKNRSTKKANLLFK